MNHLKHSSPPLPRHFSGLYTRPFAACNLMLVCFFSLISAVDTRGQVQESRPIQAASDMEKYRSAPVDSIQDPNLNPLPQQGIIGAEGREQERKNLGMPSGGSFAEGVPRMGALPRHVAEQAVVTASVTSSFTPQQFAESSAQKSFSNSKADPASAGGGTPAQKRTPLLPPSASPSESASVTSSPFRSFLSMATSLLVVVGLFLGIAWGYRKVSGAGLPGALPQEVFHVLGKVTVAPKQQWMVVQFGPKLILVGLQQGEARAICEIEDKAEVNRLRELCGQSQIAVQEDCPSTKEAHEPVLSFPFSPSTNEGRAASAASSTRRDAMKSFRAIREQGASL